MKQAPPIPDPWKLVWGQPYIDCETLVHAIEEDWRQDIQPDFRTRLLVRDSAVAIRSYWGTEKFSRWLEASSVGPQIRAILEEQLGEPGFHAIGKRLVTSIHSRDIHQIFDLIGRSIHNSIEVYIAGSIPTLIKDLTARPTTDIVFVDEIPAEIRRQHEILRQIEVEYGLILTHVQSHDLPLRWQERRQWLGDFGGLRVFLVDEYDIFVSKLSSTHKKHQDDLRVLALKLDQAMARNRLLTDGCSFLDDEKLREQIKENWRFVFQEPLELKTSDNPNPHISL